VKSGWGKFELSGEGRGKGRVKFWVVDFPPHSGIVPTETRSPIPLLGGVGLWPGFRKPHFLKERWGFCLTSTVKEANNGY